MEELYIMRGIGRIPFLKYLIVLTIVSGSCGSNTTTPSPNFTLTPTNRLKANVSTAQQTPEAKEIIEFVTETIDYTEIPDNGGDVAAEIFNEAIQTTTQLSDVRVAGTSQITSVSQSLTNNVVTTPTTMSAQTVTVTGSSSQGLRTNPAKPQSTTSSFVAAQVQSSPLVSTRKQTTLLNFDFTTLPTTVLQRSETSRTFGASQSITSRVLTSKTTTSLQTTPTYRTTTSRSVTELPPRLTTNATFTPSINTKTTAQIGISETTFSPSVSQTTTTVTPSTSRSVTSSLPGNSSHVTTSSPTTLPPSTSRSTLPPSTSDRQTTLPQSTSNGLTTSPPNIINSTPTLRTQTLRQTSTIAPNTHIATTAPNPALNNSQTLRPTTKKEQLSSSVTPKSAAYSTTTESIIIPNTTESKKNSTDFQSASKSEAVKTTPSDEILTTSRVEHTTNATIIYRDDDPKRDDDLPILLIVIASTVALLVTLLLVFFLAILCVAKRRQKRQKAKYYDYKKRWVKKAPRPKYEKVKQHLHGRQDREAAGSGWVFRDGSDPSKQITLELRPRNAVPEPEDITDNGNLNSRNFGDSFPPDMLSSSQDVAVNLDADSIGSLRLSKSLDRTNRSSSSEGDSGILALGDDTWSPTKGVPFHFISDDAVIEL